jgi:hypothetical protein
MHIIDLRDYANYSAKIPSSLLNRAPVRRDQDLWKIILAQWIDLLTVSLVTSFVLIAFSEWSETYLTSEKLFKASHKGPLYKSSLFASLMWMYFSSSLFFNHGQTLGLFAVKKRLSIKDKSFRASLRWGFISLLSALSGGVFSKWLRLSEVVVSHDYLYGHLMKESRPIEFKLVDRLQDHQQPAVGVNKAA